MTDARIPDHCAWAARGHWSRAYDAAEAEIARLTAELEEVKADRDKWFESAGAHHVASMKQAQRADRAEFELDTARAETAMAFEVAATEVMDASIVWSVDHDEASQQLAGWIRAKTPAHAKAALESKLRAERNKVRREAAAVCNKNAHVSGWVSREAILLLIEPEGK